MLLCCTGCQLHHTVAETIPATTEALLESANWTGGSANHLGVGFLSHEAQLIDAATDFVADVIAFSEPLGSECAGPEPNMLSYEVDDAAMYEAAEQQRLDHLADEDYYEPPDD